MTAFGLTMSAHAINFTDAKKNKNVVDYFLELPEAEIDDEVLEALGNPKEDARGEGYQYRMVSANRGLLPVTNGANVRFVLPRYGTVITVTRVILKPVELS